MHENMIKLNEIEELSTDAYFVLDLLKGYCQYNVDKNNELASMLYGLKHLIIIQQNILKKIDELNDMQINK